MEELLPKSVTIDLIEPVPAFLHADVQAKLAYLDSRLGNAELDPGGSRVRIETIEPLDADGLASIEKNLHYLVSAMAEDAFEPELKVLEERTGAMRFSGDPMESLIRRREVRQEGVGFYAIGPLLTTLIKYVDEKLQEIASRMGASPYRFPALISPEYLEKVQYFKNFPHSLGFVTHLNENLSDIEQFSEKAQCAGGHVRVNRDLFSDAPAMLSPTVCHHLYAALAGGEVKGQGFAATAEGNCFRFEARNMFSLERVWNFTMREVIFVGEDDFVSDQLSKLRQAFRPVLDELDLSFTVKTANDPFFVGTFRDQATYQAAFELKYEIQAPVPYRNKALAIGSYNRHGNFFGRTLDIITSDGKPACTGCFGLGFERLAFAFVAQHGADASGWPSAIQRVVADVTQRESSIRFEETND